MWPTTIIFLEPFLDHKIFSCQKGVGDSWCAAFDLSINSLDRRIETHSGRPVSAPTRSTVSEENGLSQGWTTPLDQTIPPPNFARWTHGSVTHLIFRNLENDLSRIHDLFYLFKFITLTLANGLCEDHSLWFIG